MRNKQQKPNDRNKISKYERSNKLLEIVKTCNVAGLNHEEMQLVIELETGKQISEAQLEKLINVANQEVREQEIEVHTHMEFMVRIGLYEEFIKDKNILNHIQKINYMMLLEERRRKEKGNKNLIMGLSNTMLRITAEKRNMITSIAFLMKIKHLQEENERKKSSGGKTAEILIDGNTTTIPIDQAPTEEKDEVLELAESSIQRIDISEDRIA